MDELCTKSAGELATLIRAAARQGRARRFFPDIGSNVDVSQFDRVSYAANDTDVFAAIRWSYAVRANGRQASMLMQHWLRFDDDGKIRVFRGSEDTEQNAAAFS
jgi:hypothetical protein